MSQSTALNPALYRRLLLHFGDVKVRNAGQERVATARRGIDDAVKHAVKQWGEQYLVRCPFCRSDRQLAVSYLYAQPDESGRQMLHLAHCFNRACLKDAGNRRELAEMLDAEDGLLEAARIRPGRVLTEEERTPELPTPRTPVGDLPDGHPTRRWLERLRLDPEKIGRRYDLHACPDSGDPLAHGRIVIPVVMRGAYRGWQSLAVGPDSGERMYLSAAGMRTSELIYNLDSAREYETPVVVPEPADVWVFGPMAMCPLGGSLSERQARTLRAVLRGRVGVLLLRHDRREPAGAARLRRGLRDALSGDALVVEITSNVPPGRLSRATLREMVARVAAADGFAVSFRKDG